MLSGGYSADRRALRAGDGTAAGELRPGPRNDPTQYRPRL